MPLVSMNTVNRWYRKDSWVYKNFTYLFQNPLWKTKVPTGFSLCPYYWSALFSMTFFRLFIGAVLLTRICFKPFGKLIHYTDIFFKRMIGLDTNVPAIPTFIGLFITTTVSLAIIFLGVLGVEAWGSYAEVGALPALILPTFLTAVTLPCLIYYARHGDNFDRCKVEYYTRIAAIGSVIAGALLMPTELFAVVSAFGMAFVSFLKDALHFIFIDMMVGIWDIIVYVSQYLFSLVVGFCVAFGVWLVTGIGAFAIAGVLGWVVDRMYTSTDNYKEHKAKLDEQAKIDKSAQGVLDIFAEAAYTYDRLAQCTQRDESYWSSYMHRVPEAVALAYEIARGTRKLTDNDIRRARNAALNTLELELKQRAEREAARNATCSKVTTRVGKVYDIVGVPVGRGIKTVIFAVGRGIWWVVVEAWTVLCLLYSLAKAKKQGACPYLKFTDPITPAK